MDNNRLEKAKKLDSEINTLESVIRMAEKEGIELGYKNKTTGEFYFNRYYIPLPDEITTWVLPHIVEKCKQMAETLKQQFKEL